MLCLGCSRIDTYHLSADAGAAFADPTPRPAAIEPPLSADAVAERVRILDALREPKGSISAAARRLGIHRTQLCRLLERYQIAPQRPGSTE
ncbi:MAG: helix-turn-helix domain-containing protein [Myxococcales bacterium]|nr:helix-turn-helix domain-containing protein [Myxococcales bacterium]